MTEPDVTQPEPLERMAHPIRSLRELVDFVAGKALPPLTPEEGRITEALPFPYLAIVGQHEMKLALLMLCHGLMPFEFSLHHYKSNSDL